MTRYSPQWKEKLTPSPYLSRDIEYFQGMYPQRIKEIQRYVVQHCDTMDYAGSPIYDEYPDSLVIDRACQTIYENMPGQLSEPALTDLTPGWLEEEPEESEEGNPQMEIMQWSPRPGNPPPFGPGPGGPPPFGPGPGGPPPFGPGPGGPPPFGPGPGGPPPFGPGPGGPPPFGPGPGGPPHFGPGPGGPPPFGPPPGGPPNVKPPQGGNLLSDIIKVLFMNELQRRRCRMGIC